MPEPATDALASPRPATEPTPPALGLNRVLRLAALLIIAASVILIVRSLPTAQALDLVQNRVATAGPWGPLVFGIAYIVAALLFIPGSALTLAAGAIFGLSLGTATVSIASTAAAGASFLIARYLARDRVRRMAASSRTFGAIDAAIAQGGWRIIALLRLSPAVPFSLGNYLYGLTPVRFWPYLIASWGAMLPGTFMYVYVGVAGSAAASAGTGASAGQTVWRYVLLGVGLIATIAVSVYVTMLARRALKQTVVSEAGFEVHSPAAKTASRPNLGLIVGALALALLAACVHLNRARLGGLLGPPSATLRESFADTGGTSVFDHSVFDALLRSHVDAEGFVDYDALLRDAQTLDGYIAALGRAEIDTLGRDERLAFLINAYNAFTLRLILDHYPIDSIKDIPADQRWDDDRWHIAGRGYSLNQIEHELVRPNFAEPRIHFALVCAAIGCPPLRPEAYTGALLEAQLADQTRIVHSSPRWLRLEADRGTVALTALYDWYGSDFEQSAPSVVAFAARYSPELMRMINAGREPRVTFLRYSWKLNSRANIADATDPSAN